MQNILKYFPNLSEKQIQQFAALDNLYREWNSKINVISRKDIDNLYLHHVLHSLSIAKFVLSSGDSWYRFENGSHILDFGTGGGFPGIPLAIMFPECHFKLIDGTAKKIRVVTEIAKEIKLANVEALHLRGEEERGKFDYIISRAVMPLPDLMRIARKNMQKALICLKGGDLTEELQPFKHSATIVPISDYFEEDWFIEKNIICISK